MQIEILPDAESAARRTAAVIAEEARTGAAARGRFVLALSRTPLATLQALAAEDVPWPAVHILQVDERIAPPGDLDRNITQIAGILLSRTALPPSNLHSMPVDAADFEAAALNYGKTLTRVAGAPPAIDLVHLGLGTNGHTASLLPGDPVLEVSDRDVALAGPFMGRRRMTLTYPALNRARKVVWLVTGSEKAEMLKRLVAEDGSIPAGRIRVQPAVLVADAAAGAALRT